MNEQIKKEFEAERCNKQCSDDCMYGGICNEYIEWLERKVIDIRKDLATAMKALIELSVIKGE